MSAFSELPNCHFTAVRGECPIGSTLMIPPGKGDLIFVEGADHGWRVVEVQHQMRPQSDILGGGHKLVLVNVIVKKEKFR